MATAASSSLVVDSHWEKGIIRDAARDSIPEGGLYDSADFILHKPGIAYKRGGTSYFGPEIGAGGVTMRTVAVAEFTTGAKVIGIKGDNHLYTVTNSTATDQGDVGFVTIDRPKLRIGAGKQLLVLTDEAGTASPQTWNGTTLAVLGGTPPAGRYAAIYKSRLVLAGPAANSNRIFFSDLPDIESTWDTTNSWIDNDYPITGLAALQNSLLIFSARKMHRITGSTPPPGTDFDMAPIGEVGCTAARSIVTYENRVIFGNSRGIYRTDGSANPECLTRAGGVESLWRSFFSSTVAPNRIACGLLGSFLIVVVKDSDFNVVGSLMCYLPTLSWMPVTNFDALCFASTSGLVQEDECFYADTASNRLVALSGILAPDSTNKNDADGTPVEPMLETRVLAAGPTLKHYRFGHLSLDMRDAATDNPELAISIAPGLEASTFASISESPLMETSDNTRSRLTFSKRSQGLSVRFTQSNASSKTEIYALEADARGLPIQRGGQ